MRKVILALAAVASAAILFTSCKDDDPKTPEITMGEAIAATYDVNAAVTMTVGDADPQPMPMTAKMKVTKINGTSVKVEIDNFAGVPGFDKLKAIVENAPLTGTTAKVNVDYTGKIGYSMDGTNFVDAESATLKGDFELPTGGGEYNVALEVNLTLKGAQEGAPDTVIKIVIDNEAAEEE